MNMRTASFSLAQCLLWKYNLLLYDLTDARVREVHDNGKLSYPFSGLKSVNPGARHSVSLSRLALTHAASAVHLPRAEDMLKQNAVFYPHTQRVIDTRTFHGITVQGCPAGGIIVTRSLSSQIYNVRPLSLVSTTQVDAGKSSMIHERGVFGHSRAVSQACQVPVHIFVTFHFVRSSLGEIKPMISLFVHLKDSSSTTCVHEALLFVQL